MGKMSRDKGKRSELELVHLLRDFYGYEVRRGDCFRHQPDIVGMWGIHIEVKNVQKVDIASWYWQSWEAAKKYDDGIPVVIHKENRKPWLVTLAYQDYTETMRGEAADMDDRERFNLRAEIEKYGRLRYFRQGIDLITVPIVEFMDIYGEWCLPFA